MIALRKTSSVISRQSVGSRRTEDLGLWTEDCGLKTVDWRDVPDKAPNYLNSPCSDPPYLWADLSVIAGDDIEISDDGIPCPSRKLLILLVLLSIELYKPSRLLLASVN